MLKDTALEYCRAGWPIVPVKPRGKSPLVPWTEYQQRNATEIEVAQWWDRWPNANIGAVTGRKFVVVDVDQKSGDPANVARTIYQRYPTGLLAQSGSGGYHLYYGLPSDESDLANRVSILTGVDYRGYGGIVVLPPSVTAGQYRWLSTRSVGPFPSGIFGKGSTGLSDDSHPKWVSETLEGVGEGTRNDACAHLAGYFLSKNIPPDIVQNLLLVWNEKNHPPMPAAEIATTVASVSRRVVREARKNAPIGTASARPFDTVDISDFLTTFGVHAQSWLIDDWIPEESIIMVVAPPGSYKTWLTYDLAVSLASKTPFLNMYPVHRQCKVLIIQQEDSHAGQAGRLAQVICSKLGLEMPSLIDTLFTIPAVPALDIRIHPSRSLRFEDAGVMGEFEKVIATYRPDMVVLDPLYSLTSTDDYMMKIAEHMMKLKQLRDTYKTSFLLVHHSKKNDKDGGRESAWGSQFVNASREGGWNIQRPQESEPTITLTRFFKDGETIPPITLMWDINMKTVPHKYEVLISDGRMEALPSVKGLISNEIA